MHAYKADSHFLYNVRRNYDHCQLMTPLLHEIPAGPFTETLDSSFRTINHTV